MNRKILILCIDGLGAEYIEAAPTPNISRMASEGSYVIGQSVIPSVTNVNNVSIITGVPPRVHGITSNYWLDMNTKEEKLMESPEFLCYPTVLQRAKSRGMSTALLTSKKKLLYLLNVGSDYSLSAEDPDMGRIPHTPGGKEMIGKVGSAQDIYSPEINLWLFRALRVLLKEKNPDVVYCATTDGMMHKYAPDEEASIRHIQGIDSVLGKILDENPDREIYLTADHGMSAKTRGIDIEKVLLSQGIRARAIPIIKDRYVVHHQNLGGASYVYIEDLGSALAHAGGARKEEERELTREASEMLRDVSGIEAVYTRTEAAEKFALMEDRIGDLLVLGDSDTVFGEFAATQIPVQVRSHGSRYESAVPILAYGRQIDEVYQRNFDVVARIGID